MKTDPEIHQYLHSLWNNPAERKRRHLILRDKLTVSLTDNAPDTVSWATQQIATKLNTHEKLLDVGCGPGYYLEVLSAKLPEMQLVGLDISAEALAKAKKVTAGPLVRGSVLALPFASGTYGAVMANRMLNQTGNISRALCEIYRVLKAEGILFIVTAELDAPSILQSIHTEALLELGFPAKFTRRSSDPEQRLGRENSTAWLQDTGFKEIRLEDYRREIVLEKLAEALELYATGLIFHRTTGFDEPDVSPAQWVTLYRAVEAKISTTFKRQGTVKNVEGACLIIARK